MKKLESKLLEEIVEAQRLDTTNLKIFSRTYNIKYNKIFKAVMQLIRKKKISIDEDGDKLYLIEYSEKEIPKELSDDEFNKILDDFYMNEALQGRLNNFLNYC